ncbi:hypothetical protein BDV95DRAFT_588191 [Massariosphaeria phaeospora]|uniref:F-box domain-containing protein n=1 Tax=Massariosphaeria phaeospora TaxID=100035 RepID=A0A7C8M148_9PLEO|nr:hypothetical protein BDV95DRAFT_588191 [Massariosphaeria phaeospora]
MVQTLSSDDYEQLGRSYYKKKQYEKAVEAFTTAIETSTSATAISSLYDRRAATHDKLENLNAALQDGRDAIRANKQDVRGYLRTASVLEKKNMLDKAVAIYAYGLKHVPVEHRDEFALLQQLHDRMTRKLAPAEAIDPMHILPMELWSMVIEYLSFKHRVKCIRVNRAWKNYITKQPHLWTDLDLSGAQKPVGRKFIRNAINHSNYGVTRAVIHRFQHADVLRNIASACKSLTTIEILSLDLMLSSSIVEMAQCARGLRKVIVSTDMTMDAASQILRFCPHLEHAEFRAIDFFFQDPEWKGPFTNLHTLKIYGMKKNMRTMVQLNLRHLVTQTPLLHTLELRNWNNPADIGLGFDLASVPLKHLTLSDVNMRWMPHLPPTLETLYWQPTSGTDLFIPPDADTNDYPLPKLSSFSLHDAHELRLDDFTTLLGTDDDPPTSTPLTHISLKGHYNRKDLTLFSPAGLFTTSPRLLTPSLHTLSLNTMEVTDDDIEALLTHPVSGLRAVHLASTRVTGASVQMLADALPQLASLNLDLCAGIRGRGAIEYARTKGVAVSYSMVVPSSSGRKVRYA